MSPRRPRLAPVKAPFLCPKRVSENIVSSRPATFTPTNLPSRPLRSWMALATSSLPTPVSPVTQHRLVRGGHGLGIGQQRLHPGIVRDDAGQGVLAWPLRHVVRRVFRARGRACFQGVAHRRKKVGPVHGLDQVVHRPCPHAAHGRLHFVESGDDDDRQARVLALYVVEHLFAAHLGHAQVEHDQGHLLAAQNVFHLKGILAADGVGQAGIAEVQVVALQGLLFVVHQEDRVLGYECGAHVRAISCTEAGSTTIAVVPFAPDGFDQELAAVLAGDGERDGEPEPGPAVFALGGVEGLGDLGQVLGPDAFALVADQDAHAGRGLVKESLDLDSLVRPGQGVAGVLHQIDHDLLQALSSSPHQGQARAVAHGEPAGVQSDGFAHEQHRGLHHVVDRKHFETAFGVLAGEVLELAHEIPDALGTLDNAGQELGNVLGDVRDRNAAQHAVCLVLGQGFQARGHGVPEIEQPGGRST